MLTEILFDCRSFPVVVRRGLLLVTVHAIHDLDRGVTSAMIVSMITYFCSKEFNIIFSLP